MKTNNVHFSSKTCVWATPIDLFKKLNNEFGFTCDVCALPENAKCKKYYSPKDNGLIQDWEGVCWMNPPYGRVMGVWIKKAYESAIKGATVVALIPARTDTKWFHTYIHREKKEQTTLFQYEHEKVNVEIRFIKGRLKFGGAKDAAPFPSMIVVFSPPKE